MNQFLANHRWNRCFARSRSFYISHTRSHTHKRVSVYFCVAKKLEMWLQSVSMTRSTDNPAGASLRVRNECSV